MRRATLFLLALILGGSGLSATLERLTLDDMIQKSTAIVRGRVVSSYAAPHGAVIYTHYRIDVAERWKGPEGSTLDVVVPGGVAGALRQTISGAPRLTPGSEYLLFLWTGTSGLTHVMGLSQGVFSINKNASGDTIASRMPASEVMLDSSGHMVRDSRISIRLTELHGRVAKASQGVAK